MAAATVLMSMLSAGRASRAEESDIRSTYVMNNDTISVTLNDSQFPLDDFDFPALTTHIHNLYLGFYDGLTGYYFSGSPQGGNSPLVLIGDVIETGVAPNQSITMTFGNADPATRFTIELLVEMLGNGRHGIRFTATITNLLQGQSLIGCKFYLSTDISVSASDGGDVTAYDSDSGVFYAFDQSNEPNSWFACHGNGSYELHYQGLAYPGPPGLATFHAAMVAGTNLADSVDSTPGDQVAGWNWDIGTIEESAMVGFAIAAQSNLASLILSLEDAVPGDPAFIFADGFESGDTSFWAE